MMQLNWTQIKPFEWLQRKIALKAQSRQGSGSPCLEFHRDTRDYLRDQTWSTEISNKL